VDFSGVLSIRVLVAVSVVSSRAAASGAGFPWPFGERERAGRAAGTSSPGPTSQAEAPTAADSGTSGDAIIVTGTRESGRLARQSATPIDVVKADTLTATGQSNLVDSLRSAALVQRAGGC
jgi:iron complex outermembrane receptor protein